MSKSTFGQKVDKVTTGIKGRAKIVWTWTKDHWVPLTLGALAIGGGAYMLHRKGQSEEPAGEPIVYDPDYDSEDVRETIQDAWDACDHDVDPYPGPTED